MLDTVRHACERITHRMAAPGWLVTAFGVGGDVWIHRAVTVLSACALLAGIAYHLILSACALWKTRHEVEVLKRRQRSPWFDYERLDGRN